MKPIVSLCVAFLFFVGAAHAAESGGAPAAGPAYKNVGVEQFDQLRANTNNVVLDVRTKKEFNAGHIPGAVNIDWNSPDFDRQIRALDRDKTYLVHCAVGGRSAKACQAMGALKFTHCYNLQEGIKAWEKAGKPIQK